MYQGEEGPQPESSQTANVQSQEPPHVDGDVGSNVTVHSSDKIDEEATSRDENRPNLSTGVTRDENNARLSIEIKPLFGESVEECKARIAELFKHRQNDVQECNRSPQCVYFYIHFLDRPTSLIRPDWMTPDFLYRMNYGPLTNKESYKAASFLQDQLADIKASQCIRTTKSRASRSWHSMSPFRAPICPTIDFRDQKELKPKIENPRPIVFGCLDPKLGVELLSQLYPTPSHFIPREGKDVISELRRYYASGYSQFHYTPRTMEVDMHTVAGLLLFEHNLLRLCRRRYGFRGETMVFPMGALALDVLVLIQRIKSSISIDSDFAQLGMTVRKYLISPQSYFSTAERGTSDAYGSSITPMFLKTILLTRGNHFLPEWNKDDKVDEFFFRVLNSGTPFDPPNSQRDEESSRLDISNLDASYICSGPFRLMLTACLEKHLQLDKDGILYVFWDFTHEVGSSLDIYRRHFLWDPSGDWSKCIVLLMYLTVSTVNKFQKELRLTHEILFTRSISSRKLGERLYGRSISSTTAWGSFLFDDVTSVSLCNHVFDQTSSNISNFHFFGPRIIYLLQAMENWRPRTFREIFICGYAARRDWWFAMFAIFFGFVTILGLGLSAYQAYLAQMQVALALKALNPTSSPSTYSTH